MKKLSKIAQVTFFAAAFAVLFSGTADAYIDPSVMNYAIQAVADDSTLDKIAEKYSLQDLLLVKKK